MYEAYQAYYVRMLAATWMSLWTRVTWHLLRGQPKLNKSWYTYVLRVHVQQCWVCYLAAAHCRELELHSNKDLQISAHSIHAEKSLRISAEKMKQNRKITFAKKKRPKFLTILVFSNLTLWDATEYRPVSADKNYL